MMDEETDSQYSTKFGQTNIFHSSMCVALRGHPEGEELILVEMTKRTRHLSLTRHPA